MLDVRYSGKDNLISMGRDYKLKYRCDFDVRKYAYVFPPAVLNIFRFSNFLLMNNSVRELLAFPGKTTTLLPWLPQKNP